MANEYQADSYTNGSQKISRFYSDKLELIDYFRSKKGATDNAIPETTKRITKEYLDRAGSLPDSSVIYLDILPSTRSI